MERASQILQNIDSMIRRVPSLGYVLERLRRTSIRYGLFGGSHVSIITDNRVPADIDFLVRDEDSAELRSAFPFAKTADRGNGWMLYVGEEDVIEFIGHADILAKGVRYPFRLTQLACGQLTTYATRLAEISVVDPVDTLILKALLLPGPDQGKHDAEDIAALVASCELDVPYLNARLDEIQAREATRQTWRRLGVSV